MFLIALLTYLEMQYVISCMYIYSSIFTPNNQLEYIYILGACCIVRKRIGLLEMKQCFSRTELESLTSPR